MANNKPKADEAKGDKGYRTINVDYVDGDGNKRNADVTIRTNAQWQNDQIKIHDQIMSGIATAETTLAAFAAANIDAPQAVIDQLATDKRKLAGIAPDIAAIVAFRATNAHAQHSEGDTIREGLFASQDVADRADRVAELEAAHEADPSDDSAKAAYIAATAELPMSARAIGLMRSTIDNVIASIRDGSLFDALPESTPKPTTDQAVAFATQHAIRESLKAYALVKLPTISNGARLALAATLTRSDVPMPDGSDVRVNLNRKIMDRASKADAALKDAEATAADPNADADQIDEAAQNAADAIDELNKAESMPAPSDARNDHVPPIHVNGDAPVVVEPNADNQEATRTAQAAHEANKRNKRNK